MTNPFLDDKAQAGSNPFLGIEDGIEPTRPGPAVISAQQNEPDSWATAKRKGAALGLAPEIVSRNPAEVRKLELQQSLDQVRKTNPALADWLVRDDNLTLAQDDTESLGLIGRALEYPTEIASGFNRFLGAGISGLGDINDAVANRATAGLRAVGLGKVAGALEAPILPAWANPSRIARGVGDTIVEQTVYETPEERRNMGHDVAQGLGSLVGQVVATYVNPAAAVTLTAGQGAEQQATRAEGEGASTADKSNAVLIGATITAATEKMGLDILLERLPPAIKNKAAQWVADKILAAGAEGVQEGLEQVAHNAVAQLTYAPDSPLLEGVGDNATLGALVGGLARTVLTPGYRYHERRQQGQSENQQVDALSKMVQQSKLFARDPQKLADYIAGAKQTGASNVYLPAEDVTTLFQSVPEAAAAFEAAGVSRESILETTALNSDLAIPLETYLTKIAPDYHAQLGKAARLSPDGLTDADVDVNDEQNAAVERFLASVNDAPAVGQADMRVYNDVLGQLLGRYQQADAEQMASVVNAFFRDGLGARAGIDPMALYNRYGLRIVEQVERRVMGRVDPEVDSMIERLRAGDIPTEDQAYGPTLAEFLSGPGIRSAKNEPMSGEIRTLAENDRATRKGRQRLVREEDANALTLDYAREAAVEAGYLSPDATLDDLLAALNDGGRAEVNRDGKMSGLRDALTEMDREISRLGLDVSKASNEEIRRALFGAVGTELDQPVYHGTPHTVDRFSLNRIGTGEGAQAFGWGLYFASEKAIAEHYRDTLTPKVALDGKPLDRMQTSMIQSALANMFQNRLAAGLDEQAARDQTLRWADGNKQIEDKQAARDFVGRLSNGKGNLYRVDVPEDSDLLDWDKPLSEQPEKVRAAIESLREVKNRSGQNMLERDPTGEEIYRALGEAETASKTLMSLGIPGLRYLDGNSRNPFPFDVQVFGKSGALLKFEKVRSRAAADAMVADAEAAGNTAKVIERPVEAGSANYVIWDENAIGTPESALESSDDGFIEEASRQYLEAEKAYGGRTAYDKAKAAGQTKLTYGQWVQVRTPNFLRWFGDWMNDPANASKVVDPETGEPLVVYHGTRGDFDVFGGNRDVDVSRVRGGVPSRSDIATSSGPFWFATDPAVAFADGTAGSNVMPVYLRIENPIRRSGYFGMEDFSRPEKYKYFDKSSQTWITPDGVIGDNGVIVAFRPEQIKSATANQGNFDGGDASILNQSKPSDVNDLVATHNLSAANLMHAIRMGGLPVPSLAISKGDQSIAGFGEITLIGDRNIIDPRQGAKAFGADIYSPRYPRISYKLEKSALANLNKLLADYRGDDREIYGSEVNGISDLTHIKAFKEYAKAALGNDNSTHDIEALAAKTLRDAGADERIFQGFTNSGNRRYTPHTLENVIKILKKELRGGEGGNYGTGSLRARFTPQFRSVEAIKKAKGKLQKKEAFEAARESVEKEVFAIADDLAPYYKYDAGKFGFVDTVINVIGDAAKGGLSRQFREYGFDDVPSETQQRIVDFMATLREMPTEYFEVKQLRSVGIGEFRAAAVPTGTSEEVISALRSRGLEVVEYEGGNDDARRAAVADVAVRESLLFQNNEERRGFIRFGKDRKFTIGLTQARDLSTFLHEFGHFALEVMGDVAADAETNPEIAADYATLLSWLGVNDRSEIGVEQHEKFARGFEKYLGEGTPPTPELTGAFARFRSWMKAIYKSLTSLNVELNPEVRGVMSRMLAGDAAIAQAEQATVAEPLFKEASRAGMTEQQFAAYLELQAKAHDEAETRIVSEAYNEVMRERKKWWREESARIETEVRAEFEAMPVYRAWASLARNTEPNGTPLETPPVKLSKQWLVDRYGQDFLNKNLLRKNVYAVEGGVHGDMVAPVFGYETGPSLVEALSNATPLNQAIKAETASRMRELHGDMRNDGSLPARAMKAVHGNRRMKVIEAEIAALSKLAGEPAMTTAQARSWAQKQVASKRIKDIVPYQYLRAERKAARESLRAANAGKTVESLAAARRRLANAVMFDEANKARDRFERRSKWIKAQTKKSTQENLGKAGVEFRDQVNAMLAAVSVRPMSPAEEARQKPLRAFVDHLQDNGEDTAVAESVIALVAAGRPVVMPEMAVEAFNELHDAIRNIKHIAGQQGKLLAAADRTTVTQAAEAMSGRAAESHPDRLPEALSRRDETIGTRTADRLRRLSSELDRPENIIESLDGGEAGPWHDFLWQPLNAAENTAIGLRRRLGTMLRDLRKSMPAGFMQGLNEPMEVPNVGQVSRGTLLGIVLNTGNAQNLQRLRDGGIHVNGKAVQLTDDQVQAMRDLLTADEARYVQGLWDTVNSLWPDIVALQTEMSGIPPEKVEAQAFAAGGMAMRGGYWPLAYDHSKSNIGERQSDDDAMRIMMGQGFSRATTPKGHTKSRAQNVEAPLQLDFGTVMSRHLDNVMTDLSYRKAVKDTTRLLRNQDVKDAIIGRLGKGAYDALKGSVAYAVSANDTAAQAASAARQVISKVVANSAVSALAMRPDIALGNYGSALVQALDRVGVRSLLRGWWELQWGRGDLTEKISALSPFMAERIGMIDEDYRLELTKAQGKRGYGEAYRRVMFTLHRWADHDVSRAAWWGRYQEALKAGETQAESTRLADKLIRQTQTAGARKDVSAIERDPAFRESRIFMGPMFVIFGRLNAAAKGEGATRSVGLRSASILRQMFLAPALFMLLAGRWPEDDDDDGEIGVGEWGTWLAVNTLLFPMQTIPVVREVAGSVEAAVTGRPINPRAAPTAQAAAGLVKASKSIIDNLAEYGDTGEIDYYDMTRDLVALAGPFTGAPAGQVRVSSRAAEAIQDDPDRDAAELARLALYGPPRK